MRAENLPTEQQAEIAICYNCRSSDYIPACDMAAWLDG